LTYEYILGHTRDIQHFMPQVWRPSGGSYELIGQNSRTVCTYFSMLHYRNLYNQKLGLGRYGEKPIRYVLRYAQSNTQDVLTIRYKGKHLGKLRIWINLVQILVIINVGGNNVIIKQHINNYSLIQFNDSSIKKENIKRKVRKLQELTYKTGSKC